MKKYELVELNKGLKLTRSKDLQQAETIINEKAAEGWELMQIISPNDLGGAMIGLFCREEE